MKKLFLLGVGAFFLLSCASGGYKEAIERYYQVETEKMVLLQKLVDQRIKSQEKDLFIIDLHKGGTVDKIRVSKGYEPIDPVVSAALSKTSTPPVNPTNIFWNGFWSSVKSIVPYAAFAYVFTEVTDTLAESAGNHSVNTSNTDTYNIEGTGNTTNIGEGSATGSFTYSPTETITIPQGE